MSKRSNRNRPRDVWDVEPVADKPRKKPLLRGCAMSTIGMLLVVTVVVVQIVIVAQLPRDHNQTTAGSAVPATSNRPGPTDPLTYTVLRKEESSSKGGPCLDMDVLIPGGATKQAVLALGDKLRAEYAHRYEGAVTIGIWDAEESFRRWSKQPDSETDQHFLGQVTIVGRQDEGGFFWTTDLERRHRP
jgi:hypothetical protein